MQSENDSNLKCGWQVNSCLWWLDYYRRLIWSSGRLDRCVQHSRDKHSAKLIGTFTLDGIWHGLTLLVLIMRSSLWTLGLLNEITQIPYASPFEDEKVVTCWWSKTMLVYQLNHSSNHGSYNIQSHSPNLTLLGRQIELQALFAHKSKSSLIIQSSNSSCWSSHLP